LPIHKLLNFYKDWKVKKSEDRHARYMETVLDHIQDQ